MFVVIGLTSQVFATRAALTSVASRTTRAAFYEVAESADAERDAVPARVRERALVAAGGIRGAAEHRVATSRKRPSQAQHPPVRARGAEPDPLRAGTVAPDGDAPAVHVDDPLELAMRRLAGGQVKALPVVSRTNVREVVGAVSLEDVLSAYAMVERPVEDVPAVTGEAGSRLLAGVIAVVIGVVVLGGFLSYFYRAERVKRAERAYVAANALAQNERLPEAIEQYRNAERLDPGNAQITETLTRLEATRLTTATAPAPATRGTD